MPQSRRGETVCGKRRRFARDGRRESGDRGSSSGALSKLCLGAWSLERRHSSALSGLHDFIALFTRGLRPGLYSPAASRLATASEPRANRQPLRAKSLASCCKLPLQWPPPTSLDSVSNLPIAAYGRCVI